MTHPGEPRLLSAKCRPPLLRPGALARPRLIQALDEGESLPVTLVSAPPGCGKTTLLAGWAAVRGAPVAWVSLDAGDADVVRFLDYLIAGLQHAVPGLAEAAADLLGAVPPARSEVVLTALLNDLAGIAGRLAVVMDDYHLVDSPEVHRAVVLLAEHLPAGARLVISSRSDPPLPLARWRGRNMLAEVRAADLRFSTEEAGDFLRGTMGLTLPDAAVATLAERTEGWAAGLQMAALALRGHGDPAALAAQFGGTHRYVLDYLVEEVLSGQPAAVRAFLLRTSILDRLCGPLCDAVTGEPDGTATLLSLNRQAVFLEALDEEGGWFRYHRLFSDLLQHLLDREHPGLRADLHRRAGAWLEGAGLTQSAAAQYLAAGDAARAADLVERAAEAMLADGQFASFSSAVAALPPAVTRARPQLRALQAVALFYCGRPVEEVERALADAEAPGTAAEARGTAAALRAVMAAVRGEGAAGREHAARALRLLPGDRSFLRVMAGTTLGLAALNEGDPAAAEAAFAETRRAAEAGGNLVLRVMATRRLAGAAGLRGDLNQAEALYREILACTAGKHGGRHPLAALGLIGLGQVQRERDELVEAEASARAAVEPARRLGPPFALDALAGLGRVLLARGDRREAATVLAEAVRLAEQFDATDNDDAYVAALVARLHLAEGDLAAAAAWARERGLDRPEAAGTGFRYYPEETERATLARLLLATGRPEQAFAVLDRLLAEAEARGRLGSVIELETLRALALDASGARRPALAALARALLLGSAHGHRRTFLDEGGPLATLLRAGVAAGVLPSYGKVVLAAMAPGGSWATTAPGLREPLTERERRVLRCLPGGATIPEIARELYVAPSTVRTHLKAIYRKLGVSRRGAAVERARELGLL